MSAEGADGNQMLRRVRSGEVRPALEKRAAREWYLVATGEGTEQRPRRKVFLGDGSRET